MSEKQKRKRVKIVDNGLGGEGDENEGAEGCCWNQAY